MLKSSLARFLKTDLGRGLAVNLLVVVSTLPFLLVPRTTSVRANGWGLLVFTFAIYSLVVILPPSWQQVRVGKWGAGVLGIVLALAPFPLAYWLFHLCAQIKGYELAP